MVLGIRSTYKAAIFLTLIPVSYILLTISLTCQRNRSIFHPHVLFQSQTETNGLPIGAPLITHDVVISDVAKVLQVRAPGSMVGVPMY